MRAAGAGIRPVRAALSRGEEKLNKKMADVDPVTLFRIVQALVENHGAFTDTRELAEFIRSSVLNDIPENVHAALMVELLNVQQMMENRYPGIFAGLTGAQTGALFQAVPLVADGQVPIAQIVQAINNGNVMLHINFAFAGQPNGVGPINVLTWAKELRFAMTVMLLLPVAQWGELEDADEDQEGQGIIDEIIQFWEDSAVEFNNVLTACGAATLSTTEY